MKKSVVLSLLLAGAASCMAQTNNTSLLPPGTDPKILACHEWANRVINASGQTVIFGATGINQRLIAESAYRDLDQSVLRDTIRYFYPANKGSAYNFNSLEYSFEYNPMTEQAPMIFNNDYKPGVKMDSLVRYYAPLQDSQDEKVKVVYDADGDILDYKTEIFSNAVLQSGRHYINTYNAQGRLRESLVLSYFSNQWDTLNRRLFGYNTQGLLITDSLLAYNNNTWRPRRRERMTYNLSNQVTRIDQELWVVDSSNWKDWKTDHLRYYSDGRVKELASGTYVGATFMPIYIDSLTYVPGSNFFLTRHVSISLTGPPEPVKRYTRHLNAQQLPDTTFVLIPNGGSWAVDEKYLLSYNAANNPTRKISQNREGFTVLVEHYYYELFDDPTSVGGITKTKQMRVYPNPALSELCMEWGDARQGQRVSVVLYSLAGQIVYRSDLTWKGKVQCIDVADLRMGLYHLSVRDAQGRVLHTERLLKQ